MEVLIENDVNLVQLSYGRCLCNGNIFNTFYDKFLSASPHIRERFRDTDFDQQYKLLRHGLSLLIMFADGKTGGKIGLERIRATHSRSHLDIPPQYYALWKEALLAAIPLHDPKANGKTLQAWSVVLDRGITYITSGY